MADVNGIPVSPFDVPSQQFYWDGKPGLCTPSIINNANLLVGWSFQTVLFQWDTSSGDLVSPATDFEITAYESALNDPIPGGWYDQNENDTNLPEKQEGSPVCRGNMFFASGLIVEALFPFSKFEATTTSATYERAFLKDGQNGPAYGSRVQRTMLNRVSISVKHNNPVVEYSVGVARQWPGWPNVSGNAHTTNGQISVVAYVPFLTPVAFGPKDDCRQLSVVLKFGQQHIIQNDVTQPIPTDLIGDLLYAPMVVTLVGKVCTDLSKVVCVAPVNPPAARPY